jgi:asparagine synthase (glutamine-hydrolysing)
MNGYVVCVWPPDNLAATGRVRRFQAAVTRTPGEAWTEPQSGIALLAGSRKDLPVRVLADNRGVVLGDMFGRSNMGDLAHDLDLPGAAPTAWAEALLATTWGAHVAVLREGASARPWIYREPSGALDCHVWRDEGVTFAAADLPSRLRLGLPLTIGLDWNRVAEMLADPRLMAGPSALRGVVSVQPGSLLHPDGQSLVLWTPAKAARAARPSTGDALRDIPRLVDRCVESLAAGRTVLAEVSGGLDSAIVGSALRRAAGTQVVAWINYHPPDIEADERRSAQAIADHLGVPLTIAAKPDTQLDPEALVRAAAGARPSLNRVDPHYETDMAGRVRARGANAIFTGQGGDTVFFQMPTPLVAADAWAARGPGSWMSSPLLGDVARWTRRSAWDVMTTCCLGLAGFAPSPILRNRLVPTGALASRRAARPAWTGELDGIPPAKRRQIEGLAHTQLFFGACARAEAGRLIHPLLSTPLVEYMLSVSADDLTAGGRDRALVRRAFSDRLPHALAVRRSKGIMTAYYGRMLAASLTELRPWLLEGPLAQRGLIDRRILADMLTTEALLWRGGYAELMALVALQGWVETWL